MTTVAASYEHGRQGRNGIQASAELEDSRHGEALPRAHDRAHHTLGLVTFEAFTVWDGKIQSVNAFVKGLPISTARFWPSSDPVRR
jgi:hypothetical protein